MGSRVNEQKELSPAVKSLREFLYEKYGLYFSREKLFILQHKLGKLARQAGSDSIEAYAERVLEEPAEVPKLLDIISTNKTYFFRETDHWDFLVDKIIPQWEERRELQLWSAACATGEEPYSAAMLLQDEHSRGPQEITGNFRVLGSDFSHSVLSVGVTGEYGGEELDALRSYRPQFESRYFKQTGDGKYKIIDKLRRGVVFREYNLYSDAVPFESSIDLILCRNVLIYFDRLVIQRVISNLERALKPGGYLFISHTESLHGIETDLEQVRPAIFRK